MVVAISLSRCIGRHIYLPILTNPTYSYTLTFTRLLSLAASVANIYLLILTNLTYSYTPTLTRLLLHAYSYTPTLTRLVVQVANIYLLMLSNLAILYGFQVLS